MTASLIYREVRGFCNLRAQLLFWHMQEQAEENNHYVIGASHAVMAVLARPDFYSDVIRQLDTFSPGLSYGALLSTTNSAMGTFSKPLDRVTYDESGVMMLEKLHFEGLMLTNRNALFEGLQPMQVVRAALMSKSTAIRYALRPLFGQRGYQPELARSFGRL